METLEERYKNEKSRRVALERQLLHHSAAPSPLARLQSAATLSPTHARRVPALPAAPSPLAPASSTPSSTSPSPSPSPSPSRRQDGALAAAIESCRAVQHTLTPRGVLLPPPTAPAREPVLPHSSSGTCSSGTSSSDAQMLALVECLELERALHTQREAELEEQLRRALAAPGTAPDADSAARLQQEKAFHDRRYALLERELALLRASSGSGGATATTTTAVQSPEQEQQQQQGQEQKQEKQKQEEKQDKKEDKKQEKEKEKEKKEEKTATTEDLKAATKRLVAFEDGFARTMAGLQEVFVAPVLRQAFDPTTQQLIADSMALVTRIGAFAQKLHARLKRAARHGGAGVGDALADVVAFVPAVEAYGARYERLVLMLAELRKGAAFAALAQRAQAAPVCAGRPLEEVLCSPVAHAAQYAAQAAAVRAATPAASPEAAPVARAHAQLAALAPRLDAALADARGVLGTLAAARRLGLPLLLQPQRRARGEFDAALVDARRRAHRRHFFLFNDTLVETRVRSSSSSATSSSATTTTATPSSGASGTAEGEGEGEGVKYRVVESHSLDGARVADVPDEESSSSSSSNGGDGTGHVLRLETPEQSLTLAFDTAAAKQECLAQLRALVPLAEAARPQPRAPTRRHRAPSYDPGAAAKPRARRADTCSADSGTNSSSEGVRHRTRHHDHGTRTHKTHQ